MHIGHTVSSDRRFGAAGAQRTSKTGTLDCAASADTDRERDRERRAQVRHIACDTLVLWQTQCAVPRHCQGRGLGGGPFHARRTARGPGCCAALLHDRHPRGNNLVVGIQGRRMRPKNPLGVSKGQASLHGLGPSRRGGRHAKAPPTGTGATGARTRRAPGPAPSDKNKSHLLRGFRGRRHLVAKWQG